jgi:hypothetical protein
MRLLEAELPEEDASVSPGPDTQVVVQRRRGSTWLRWLVLGGVVTAVALGVPAGVSGAGLITGSRIADNSITSRNLHNGRAITTRDVANHSLTRADFPGARTGRRGPQGLPGATGATGLQGNPAISIVFGVTSAPVVLQPLETRTLTANCPVGTQVVTGGLSSEPEGLLTIHVSELITGGTGWALRVENPAAAVQVTATVRAVCVA